MKPKKIGFALILMLCGLAVGFALMGYKSPGIVQAVRALPEAAAVDYSGPADAPLIIVHLRDWHFVPKELADLEGLDFSALLSTVEKVQADQLGIARFLVREHGAKAIYCEGLSGEALPALRLRLDLLRDMDALDKAGKLDPAEKEQKRSLALEVGTPGRLLALKEIVDVLPLEDQKALEDAKPEAKGGEILFDAAKVKARRIAMVSHLPVEGLAVVILGGSHDLEPHLPTGTLYVKVTPKNYPQ
ncbi:MAG: hypothetical protein HY040_18680 [Planctomycetes bacterium]|nr:hypothetical protein [Planctomycetota bacterium]